MAGFTKLFSGIVASTIWREAPHVKIVWITMLALADRNGAVSASVPGLADLARVPVDQARDALARLEAPDPDSRTKEHEGRRIEPCDGGWRLLNYVKYRELRNADERRIQTREAVRRFRQRHVSDVSTGNHGKPKQKQKQKQKQTTTETETKDLRSRAKTDELPGSERHRTEKQGMASIRAAIEAAGHHADTPPDTKRTP